MCIRRSHLGLTVEYDRQQGAEKTRGFRGWTIYVLVNLGLAGVILQVIFLHQESFEGYLDR
jgi:hypothetical protein